MEGGCDTYLFYKTKVPALFLLKKLKSSRHSHFGVAVLSCPVGKIAIIKIGL